jgi:four helix bundle protein
MGLRALELAEQLSIECNLVSKSFPAYEQDGLADQLRRAASSAALNIAEGACKRSNREYAKYLDTSHNSLKEVRAILRIAHGSQYIDDQRYEALEALRDEASRTLFGLMRSVQRQLDRGEITRSLRSGKGPDSS